MLNQNCTNGVEISFDYNTWTIKTNYENYESTDNTRVKCSLYFTDKYIEPILNGTDPVLENPLLPVTISDDGDGTTIEGRKELYERVSKTLKTIIIKEYNKYDELASEGTVEASAAARAVKSVPSLKKKKQTKIVG